MLRKGLKKRLASCLCAMLAVTCMLSSIPVQAQSRSSESANKVNLASGLTYETNWLKEDFNSDTYSDYNHVKMTDGKRAGSIWGTECAGFKKRANGEPVTFTFDLGGQEQVNEVNFSGWDGNESGVRNPSHFKVEYTDDSGEWQLFYEGDIGRASPEGAEVAYQYGYEMPDNGSVTTQNIRLSLTFDTYSGVAFLDEIEILSPASTPSITFVNVARGCSYTSENTRYYDKDGVTWDDNGGKLTDGQKGNGNWDSAYVGYKFVNGASGNETDRPWDWIVDLGGLKEINGISFSGWALYNDYYIYQPKFYNFYYTDENGDEQEFYLFPDNHTGLGYDNQTYTMSYSLPNNKTVKASSVRINAQPFSIGLFLDEIEVMGIDDGNMGSTDLPQPPVEDVEIISSGLKYTANYADFAAGHADNARTKLTNGVVATTMEDSSNNVGFNVKADEPLQLTFKLPETKDFKGLTICGWSDSVVPSYTVSYRNPDSTWTSLPSGTADSGRYTASSVIAGDYSASTDEVRVTLSVSQDAVVYLDEIIAYEVKPKEPSTIDPNNIIGGLTYVTNLKDGDANAGTGDFNGNHSDVERTKMTDGKKAPANSTWGDSNVVGFHTPISNVAHDDPDERRIIMEFNLEEAKSFQQVSFNGFADAVSGILFPSHLLIEYRDTEGVWQTLYDRYINTPAANMYNFSYLVPDDGSITATGIRLSISCRNGSGWAFIDEIEVLAEATVKNPTLNPEASKCHNLLEGIRYTTTLQDGDANKGEGNFHGSHPDVERKLLTDGLYSTGYSDPNGVYFNSRDSAYTIPADIVFDLGESKTFEQINISTVGNEYIYLPAKAVIKVSDDQETWKAIYSGNWSGEDNSTSKEFILTVVEGEPITARYIRFEFYHRFNWMGLDEIQVYDHETGNIPYGTLTFKQPPLEELRNTVPTISEDGTHIILPESPSEYFDVGLFGSDNQAVIDLDGNIHTPLVDTTVNLICKAIDKETEKIVKGDYNVQLTIPGQYTESATDNEKPDTMPALREWKGFTGDFTLNDHSAIVIDASADARTREIANQIKDFFKEMLGKTVTVEQGAPVAGDIYLKLSSSIPEMGEEGYYMEVGDIVTITAYGHTGLLYGGVSITQILYSDPWHMSIPKGIARDYPMYSVRGGMIDVARAYIPMEYLQEITRYMAWFKLNEIHVHINDRGENNYAAFRLESDIPTLTSEDGYYTKDEYREYQKDALKYGIKVVTEFDTPGHSNCFANIPGIKMLDSSHIDITDPGSVEAIKGMFDEFLGGDDPVIITDTVHIGADEYPYTSNEGEAIRQYTYDIANYVKELGYTPRFWGGLWYNSGLPNGVESNPGVQTNGWAHDTPSISELYDMDYDIVNTYNMILYSVPGGNYGFANYYDLTRLYNDWNPNWFEYKGAKQMPLGHPQTIGAEFAIWNDVHTSGGGTSYFDVFQRVKYGVMLVAEKDWQGAPTEKQNYAEFSRRKNLFWNEVPGANPNRYVPSKWGKIVDYDFEAVDSNTVKDYSGNGYNGTLNNVSITEDNGNHVATFDGSGYLSLPMDSVGYPFSVEFDIMLTDNSSKDATLFSGAEGTFYLNIDGTGKLGFKRDGYVLKNGKAFFDPQGYTYAFDYSFPLNKWVHVKIHSESNNSYNDTFLVIDGKEYKAQMQHSIVQSGVLTKDTQYSTTTVLPTEKIGDKMVGSMDNLSIIDTGNYTRSPNLALYKDVTMSSRETDSELGPEMAVDGQIVAEHMDRSRASFGREDDQWLIVDLGEVQTIDRVVLYPFEQAPEFEILISKTGNENDWQQIFYKKTGTAGGERGQVYTVDFDPTEVRYVKYHQFKMWTHPQWGQYSGSISEIEVYKTAGDYDVTIGHVEGGKVTSDLSSANAGDKVTLNVTPNADYAVKSVKVNGSEISANNGVYSFTMPARDVVVTAEFISNAPAAYKVDIAAAANGTVESNKRIAVEGDKVTLFVTPAEGYRIKSLQVNGTAITAVDGIYSFTMPAATASVTAEFELIPDVELYNISITETANGTVTADRQTAAEGDKVMLTVTPADGYSIDNVKVNGVAITAVGGEYSFIMPAQDVEVTAAFKKNETTPSYKITVANIKGGVIVPEKATAKAGEVIRVSVVADEGYYLDTIYCNDEELIGYNGIYSFVMPAEDVLLTASFKYYGGSSDGGSSSGGSSGGGSSKPSKPVTPTEPTWEEVNGIFKLKGTDGKYLTGWQKVDGKTYYLNKDGVRQTNWQKVDGKWYYLDAQDVMSTGWLKLQNTWYYLNKDGVMKTGWVNDGGKWYYLKSWGGMANTEWVQVGNTWYYFKGNGEMFTGWLNLGNAWYYLKDNGAMALGWNWVGNKCYYFYDSGKMAANTTVGSYKVDANGAWVK